MKRHARIRVREVRVIDDTGQQLGIMPPQQALTIARGKGLDLVEIAATATPPVCRIMDYGKFKYKESKKQHQKKAHAHVSQMKELWMGPNTEDHDRDVKMRQAKGFLEKGDRVQVTVDGRHFTGCGGGL